jgi:hypothetical protein
VFYCIFQSRHWFMLGHNSILRVFFFNFEWFFMLICNWFL